MSTEIKKIEVNCIDSVEKLTELPPFKIAHLLWGTTEIPNTYGYIGFVPEDGFYVKMICEERNPLRMYTKDNQPVYRDSAVEEFFLFESNRERLGRATYLNFEMNANGALLASYGKERTYRSYFTKEEIDSFACVAEIEEGHWSVSFRLPIATLESIYGPLNLGEGSYFTCNFYKISEAKEIEHYASFAPIKSLIPSFHLREFFAEAKIV